MSDLPGLMSVLRTEGGEPPGVEVESAAGGLPESIVPTLCAFANRPGGGTILLGLAATQSFGNLAASLVAGTLWTALSPTWAFANLALAMLIAATTLAVSSRAASVPQTSH